MKYYAVNAGNKKTIIKGEWKDVEPKVRSLITGVPNPKFKGFKTEAEALEFLKEGTSAEQKTAYSASAGKEAFEFKSDAVIFVDGSRNFDVPDFDGKKPNRSLNKDKGFYYSPYGMIIFFRDGSVYVESAKLIDGQVLSSKETSMIAYRNGFTIDKDGRAELLAASEEQIKIAIKHQELEFNYGCVLTSWNDSSELEAARRALDICFNEKKLRNVDIFYDCQTISKVGNCFYAVTGQAKEPVLGSNITAFVGDFCRKLNDGSRHIDFHWIPAHGLGPIWAKFNDCVDVLAKAETYNKPIGKAGSLNPNLAKEGVKPFEDSLTYSEYVTEDDVKRVTAARRKQAYNFIYKVLKDESIRPKFI